MRGRVWNGWVVRFSEYNTAAFCKQDVVQALDSEGLKIFARQRICGHKPADSSRAAVGIEQCDECCSNNFQAGESTRVQSKREAECKGSVSGPVKKKYGLYTREKIPQDCVFQSSRSSCKSWQPVFMWVPWEDRSVSLGTGKHRVVQKCYSMRHLGTILWNFQRKVPALGFTLEIISVLHVVL